MAPFFRPKTNAGGRGPHLSSEVRVQELDLLYSSEPFFKPKTNAGGQGRHLGSEVRVQELDLLYQQ